MPNALMSKIKIGTDVYDLKDADSRSKIATLLGSKSAAALGTAAFLDSVGTVAEGGTNLPTAGAVHTAIQTAVADLAGAMHFIGKIEGENFAKALAAYKTAHPTYTEKAGDIVIYGVKEYVYDGTAWQELGDESIYETTAHAAQTYVAKTRTICGIDLQDDVTADEMKTALGLKALAYKDSASGTVSTADSITGAAYTPAGSVAVELNQTSTAMSSSGNFTPAGTVSGSVTATGTVSIAKDATNGTQISGTVSTPTITVTPATAQIQHISSVGSLPSFTAAQYTAPSVNEAKSAFATAGVVAAMDENDTEMLVFSAAGTAQALTGTGFNAGSYTAAEFDAGSLPTLGTAQTVVTGITSATATQPTFTGDKFAATFAGNQAGDAITATFAGTEGAVSVSGNYDKASVKSAGFTGTEATITPTLVKTNKTVTVE